jgi:hypothetical protein
MTAFAHAAVTRADKCQTRLDAIAKECASLGALYGETNGAKWEELFKIFDEFVQQVCGGRTGGHFSNISRRTTTLIY